MSAQSFTLLSDAEIVAPKEVCVSSSSLLPFGSVGWKYLKIDALPAGWETNGFDDSGWTNARAAFGDSDTDCSLPEPIYTSWRHPDVNTFLLIRIHFPAPAGLINPEVSNSLSGVIYQQFLNGILIDVGQVSDACPTLGNIVSFPSSTLFIVGDNVLAVALTKPGPNPPESLRSFYDVSILSCGPITSDAYIVSGEIVTLQSDAVISSLITQFSLTSDAFIVSFIEPLAAGQQNLTSQYLQKQRDALLPQPCTTCAPIQCVEGSIAYSLESPEFPIVIVCSPEVDCSIIGSEFHLICCDGSRFDYLFSPEISQEDRRAIINEAIANCARKVAFCNIDPCPTPPCDHIWIYGNSAATCTEKCPVTGTFVATVPAGTYFALSKLEANLIAARAACALAKDHRICMGPLDGTVCADSLYSDELVISGKYLAGYPMSDIISVIDGSLPSGIVLNDGSSFITGGRAKLEGTPTVPGTYTFTIQIVLQTFGSPGFGDRQQRIYTIVVAGISPTTLPDAKIGQDYDQALTVSPAHDNATEVWTLITSLPAGLELDQQGFITGTPDGPSESHNVTVKCCFDINDEPMCCTKQYTLTVNEGACTQQTIVPYQDTDWKYLQIGVDTAPPANYETIAFDDSGWTTGQAAFGEGPEIGPPCPLIATVATPWTRDTRLVLRKHVTLAAGTTNVRLRFGVDNEVLAIWFNGVLLASNIFHNFCPSLNNYEYMAGNGTLIVGDNVVAVLCRDHYLVAPPNGDQSFFDLSVVACVP